MNERTDSWIDSALEDLAAADAHTVVPPELESAVLRAWDAQQTARSSEGIRAVRWRKAAAWALVPAAAAVVAIAVLAGDPAVEPDRRVSALPADPVEALAPAAMNPGYVIVPEPFPDTATLHVVRVRMARMALAALGVPITDPDAEGLVDVEMLVGDDGVARSIRNATFVRENTERGAER